MDVPDRMLAMVLDEPGRPLEARQVPVPHPGPGEVLIRVRACGVCRTDLHVIDGELREPKLPLILGCGRCRYCLRGQENLCERALFTGYTLDGGFAQYAAAHEDYVFALPEGYSDAEAAPLLCAGLIGYRTYRMAGDGVERLGIYGFGSAAHIVAQIALYEGKQLYAFTRPGDAEGQRFARSLGAVWAGASTELPPEQLDAALIFAPVGSLLPAALRACARGGTVVCGGIHMSDIPQFPYALLWEERSVRSVANLTRRDAEELLALAPRAGVRTHVSTFPLEEANEAIARLRGGRIEGSAVLLVP